MERDLYIYPIKICQGRQSLQEKNQIINSTNYQENTDRLVEDLNSVHCEAADVPMLKKSSKVNKKQK